MELAPVLECARQLPSRIVTINLWPIAAARARARARADVIACRKSTQAGKEATSGRVWPSCGRAGLERGRRPAQVAGGSV